MSKIPQDEWETIAQRYSRGETLSSIARHYGCTPPAVHHILKQVKKLKSDTAESQVVARPQAAAGVESQHRPDAPRTNQISPPIEVAEEVLSRPQPLPFRHPRDERGGRHSNLPAASGQNGRSTAAAQKPLGAGRAPALTAELDTELQVYAETAIQADRVKTRCSAVTDVLPVTKDHERHLVTLRIALIDRVGVLSGTTRYDQPGRSDQAQMVGLLSPARLSLPPSICQMR